MRAELVQGAWLLAPLFVGLAFHGLCIRFRWLRRLAIPVDGGRTLRGKRLFGDNKTWRGIVAVALGTGLGVVLLDPFRDLGPSPHAAFVPRGATAFALGLVLGAVAMFGELPNSALKRQLGVGAGEQATGPWRALFHVLDQVDVLAGAWVVLALVVWPTAGRLLGSFLFLYLGHQVITLVGYGLGMRETWR
jgi:hypothetical protein